MILPAKATLSGGLLFVAALGCTSSSGPSLGSTVAGTGAGGAGTSSTGGASSAAGGSSAGTAGSAGGSSGGTPGGLGGASAGTGGAPGGAGTGAAGVSGAGDGGMGGAPGTWTYPGFGLPQPECTVNADCPDVPKYCLYPKGNLSFGSASPQHCVDGHCLSEFLAGGPKCPSGQVCFDGACGTIPSCGVAADCPPLSGSSCLTPTLPETVTGVTCVASLCTYAVSYDPSNECSKYNNTFCHLGECISPVGSHWACQTAAECWFPQHGACADAQHALHMNDPECLGGICAWPNMHVELCGVLGCDDAMGCGAAGQKGATIELHPNDPH